MEVWLPHLYRVYTTDFGEVSPLSGMTGFPEVGETFMLKEHIKVLLQMRIFSLFHIQKLASTAG